MGLSHEGTIRRVLLPWGFHFIPLTISTLKHPVYDMSNNKPPTAKPSERVMQARRTQSVQCLQDMVGQWGKEPNLAPTACTLAPHGNFPCRNLLQYQTNSQIGNWILRGRMILNPDTRDLRAKPASCRAQVSPSQRGKIIRGGHEHLPDQSEDNVKKPQLTMRERAPSNKAILHAFPLRLS